MGTGLLIKVSKTGSSEAAEPQRNLHEDPIDGKRGPMYNV